MGSRANYVIIRDGKVSASYAHWGADSALDDALDGPDGCERLARGCEEVDELMDWTYCEGGYLLDFDRKQALFFGYGGVSSTDLEALDSKAKPHLGVGDCAPEIEAARELWSGWRVLFALRGIDDVSLYLEKMKLTGQVKTSPRRPPERPPVAPGSPPCPPRRLNKRKKKGP